MAQHLILVTRARPEAERTAEALHQRGHASLIAPLTQAEPSGEPPPGGRFDALLATSGRAALPAAEQAEWLALPVYCVGARTAEVFRDAGFSALREPAEDRHALTARLLDELRSSSACLAVLGEDRHEDWLEALEAIGHRVTRWTAYRARALDQWSPAAAESLANGRISAVLHFSPRQAELFLSQARDHASRTAHVALSDAVAAPLVAAGLTPWVASKPDETHLLDRLDEALASLPAPAPIRQNGPQQNAAAGATTLFGNEIMARKANRTGCTTPPVEEPATGAAQETMADAAPAPEAIVIEPAANMQDMPPEPAEPKPSPAPAAQPARSGTSLPVLLAAALLGGGVAGGATMLLPKFLPAPAPAPVADPRVSALDQRLAALESALTTSTRGQAELKAALDAAGKRLDAMAANPAAGGTDTVALAQLTERLARIEAAQPELTRLQREAQDALKLSRETGEAARRDAAAISQRLASAEQVIRTPATPSTSAQAALRLALLDRIRTNLAAGQPFEAEIAALQSHGLSPDALRPLAALAKGAPKLSALIETVRQQRKVLSEDIALSKTGWGDRLLQMADQLVQVRRVDGPADQPTPAGLTLAMEQALAAGDVVKAAASWNRLPEPARRATAGLGDDLARRAAAEAALSTLTATELAAVAGR